jgi:thiamine-monophosphate kinase
MLIEGVHFDLDFCDPVSLGRKSLAVNLSDIAAMGGIPRHFLLSLAMPAGLPLQFVDAFVDGLLGMAAEYGVILVGGDTCSSGGGLCISITLLGEQTPAMTLPRTGASLGDSIFVTGTIGDSALGLTLLRQGVRKGPYVEKHLNPTPRVREGQLLAASGIPTAMIDISDGLLSDLGHILHGSSTGAAIHTTKIPVSDQFHRHVAPSSRDFDSLVLAGGEDYELLFTAPGARKPEVYALFAGSGTMVTEIGEIVSGNSIRLVTSDGEHDLPTVLGFNHFG